LTIFAASSLNEATLFESADDLEDECIEILPSAVPSPKDATAAATSADDIASALALKKDGGSSVDSAVETQGSSVALSSSNTAVKLPNVQRCAWGDEPLLYGSPEISYGIRTEHDDLICAITVSRTCVQAGDVLRLWLSFDQSTQGSHCVRATLLQRETRRSDNAILKVDIYIYI
jgi:hypothetical protein